MQSRGRPVEHRDLYKPEAARRRVSEQQAARPVHPVVLFAHEFGDLAQALLVVRLCADVDEVSGQAGQAALAVGGAAGSFGLRKVVIQLVYCVLEGLAIQLQSRRYSFIQVIVLLVYFITLTNRS